MKMPDVIENIVIAMGCPNSAGLVLEYITMIFSKGCEYDHFD
jgi:hypothetical protein